MAALGALQEDGGAVAEAAPAEPQIDSLGRSYATGRRKDASARVWVKRGTGRINVNGKDVSEYFARPVLQMLLRQPLKLLAVMMNLMSSPRSRAAGFPVGRCCPSWDQPCPICLNRGCALCSRPAAS